MDTSTPVTFLNKNGLRLFGIFHQPTENKFPNKAIIILSPGIKSRVAPHRLYLKMAKCYIEMGFNVLRFDFSGLGDSEGEVAEKNVADFYGSVQVGRYVDDTLSAMDWLEEQYKINKIILAGLCGGAITGLLAGTKDKRVESLLGLGIPVILDSANIDQARYMTKGQLKEMRDGYIKNVFSLKRWIRLLTFQSDYRTLVKSIFQPYLEKFKGKTHSSSNQRQQPSPTSDSNFNKFFPLALKEMLSSRRKILFIFSEADRLFWEFEEKYMTQYRNEIQNYLSNLTIHIIKDANHVFTFKEWQEDMLEQSKLWLLQEN